MGVFSFRNDVQYKTKLHYGYMAAYIIQVFLFRFIQLLVFSAIYKQGFEIYVILIDTERTLLQLFLFGAMFIIQLSIFVVMFKKIYFKRYLRWLSRIRPKISAFWGIYTIAIPVIIFFIYYYVYWGTYNEYLDKTLFLFVLFFFFGALTEEFVFRGYFYKVMIKKNKKNAVYLILFQAFLFTIMHINNPGNTYARIGIVFFAGILLGIIALRGFIYVLIFHFLWNFLQAYMMGLSVSGYRFPGSLYTYSGATAWENNYYTGLFVVICSLFALFMFIRNRKQFV